jgi:hypothetical protein
LNSRAASRRRAPHSNTIITYLPEHPALKRPPLSHLGLRSGKRTPPSTPCVTTTREGPSHYRRRYLPPTPTPTPTPTPGPRPCAPDDPQFSSRHRAGDGGIWSQTRPKPFCRHRSATLGPALGSQLCSLPLIHYPRHQFVANLLRFFSGPFILATYTFPVLLLLFSRIRIAGRIFTPISFTPFRSILPSPRRHHRRATHLYGQLCEHHLPRLNPRTHHAWCRH